DLLENDIAIGICEDFLVDAIASTIGSIGQLEDWHTRVERVVLKRAVTLFLREKIMPVGDNESHIAGARLVNPRKVDFVQDAVTQGEPDLTVLVQSSAGACLCAGGPTRRNAWPARGVADGRFTHKVGVVRELLSTPK